MRLTDLQVQHGFFERKKNKNENSNDISDCNSMCMQKTRKILTKCVLPGPIILGKVRPGPLNLTQSFGACPMMHIHLK